MATVPSSADVVVVGSGVVGALAAYHAAKAGLSVIMIEAGPRIERWEFVERFRNLSFERHNRSDFQGPFPEAPNALEPRYFPENNYIKLLGVDGVGYKQSYLRLVGGTTWHWAASCWRHLPVDMKMKSTYGVGRDWPMSYEELEPYYVRAEEALGVAGPNETQKQSPADRSKPYPLDMIPWGYADTRIAEIVNPHGYNSVPIPQARGVQPYDGRPACCGNNNCQPICPIGAMYSGIHHVVAAEKAGATLIDNSVVYKIETDARNRIAAVHYLDLDKKSFRVTGRAFVLACNGIETPRLLLMAADDRNPTGIANTSDQVGRNMMDHSGFHAFFQAGEPLWIGRGPAQSSCMVGPRDGPFRSEHSASKFIINNIAQTGLATAAALQRGLVGKALDDEIRRRTACGVDLSISLEPLPNPENRLTLSKDRRDPMGLPCPDITYDVGDYVRKGAEAAKPQLRHICELMNGTELNITTGLNANNHVMGGTIMGSDPRDSVVDKDCRAHDHENLWLPGGAAIPSASVVNSTLTMAALGIKAADSVISSLKQG
jgi:choline dehydrogenase-like flavoprotein